MEKHPAFKSITSYVILALLGVVLMGLGRATFPDYTIYSGTVVLPDTEALGEFSTRLALTEVDTYRYVLLTQAPPYAVQFGTVVKSGVYFPYGDESRVTIGNNPTSVGMPSTFEFLFGLLFLLGGVVFTLITAIWPRWSTHNLKLKTEWTLMKKKEENGQDSK